MYYRNPESDSCHIFSIGEDIDDHSELEDYADKDFWDIVEEAEKLFVNSGIRMASYEEPYTVCVDKQGRVLGVTVLGNPGYMNEAGDEDYDPRIVLRFSVAVAEDARRQGIARRLIQDIIDSHPDDEFQLEAWVINPHIVALLEQLGFEAAYSGWSPDSPFMSRP